MINFGRLDGWIHGLYMACIGFPLYNVGVKFSIEKYGSHPLVFLCFSTLLSGLLLLVFSGRGRLAMSSLKVKDTWLLAFLDLLSVALGTCMMFYINAFEASLLVRFAGIVCFIIVLIMGQSTNVKECFFTFVALLGISILFFNLDITTKQKAITFLFLISASLCQALRFLLAEFHKTSNEAKTLKDNARVAGIINAISGLFFTFIFLFIAYYNQMFDLVDVKVLPKVNDFFNIYTLFCAFIFAGFLTAIEKYCELYAAKKISAKYVSVMIATTPMFALMYEIVLSGSAGYALNLSALDIICLMLLVGGNAGIAIVAILDMKKQSKETELRAKYITASDENVEYSIELVKSTMNFTNNDIEKTIELLGVEEKLIVDLLAAETVDDVSLSQLDFYTLNKNYYLGVSTKDSLTKINNRGALEQKVQDIIYKKEDFSLCYIDLDKFKPINDMYGHDMGDEVLKHVANIMLKVNPTGINGRNGGDEFVMIIFNYPEKTLAAFEKQLAKPFKLNGNVIKISASTGMVKSQGQDLLDDLIKLADETMYKDKKAQAQGV